MKTTTKKPAAKTAKNTAAKRTAQAPRPATAATKKAATAPPAPVAKAPAAVAKPAAKEQRRTMFGAAKALIAAGKTNADVLDMLRREFDLPAAHDYYPRWYRARMVMDGLITKAFARDHAGPPVGWKPANR